VKGCLLSVAFCAQFVIVSVTDIALVSATEIRPP